MKCPSCNAINPDDAIKCYCGYDFSTHIKALWKPFEKMSAWEFFSNSWHTYRVDWVTFLVLGAIYTAVLQGLRFGSELKIPYAAWFLINFIVYILTVMALTIAANKASERETIGVCKSYILAFRLFGRYIWTGLLYILIVWGGLILFIIPGIIWGTRYILAPFAVIVEGKSGKDALSYSAGLIKGKTGGIFIRELVFGFGFLIFISVPMLLLTWLIAIGLNQPFNFFPNSEFGYTIRTFGSSIQQGLFCIFNVLLFKSLRKEKSPLEIAQGINADVKGIKLMKGGFHPGARLGLLSLLFGVIGQLTAHIEDIVVFLIDNGIIFGPGNVEASAFVIVLLTFPVNLSGFVFGLLAIIFGVTATIKSIRRNYKRASAVIVVAIVGVLLNSFLYIESIVKYRDMAISMEKLTKIEENDRKGDGEALALLQKIVNERLMWSPRAACILGKMYENGQGVPKDYEEAVRWYLRSYNYECMFRAGEMYEKGQGILQDNVKAARCYRKAIFFMSKGSHKNGEYRLGQLYEKGLGVKRDYAKAVSWYRAAAHHKDEHAIIRLNDLGEEP